MYKDNNNEHRYREGKRIVSVKGTFRHKCFCLYRKSARLFCTWLQHYFKQEFEKYSAIVDEQSFPMETF